MDTTKTFAYGVANTIKEYLPEEYQDYKITVEEKVKNNNVVHVGIQVNAPGDNVSPLIYMESFFEEIKSGEPIEDVMESIAEVIKHTRDRSPIAKGFNMMDYGQVKDMITPMLVNTKANRQMLMQVPHVEVEDLSIICKLDVPIADKDSSAHTKIYNNLMDMWKISKDELFAQAFENVKSNDQPVLSSMFDVLDTFYADSNVVPNMLETDEPVELGPDAAMFVLANESRNFGAVSIVCPGVAEKIGELFPQGYYVLPSSLHETLIIPKSPEMNPKALGEMVRDVNRDVVSKEEILSDRVYEFDKEKGRIKQVPESIQKSRGVER